MMTFRGIGAARIAQLMQTTALVGLCFSAPAFFMEAGATEAVFSGLADQVAQASLPNFDIPAQPLAGALTAFGQQSGLQVTVDSAILAGLSSPGVKGAMAPRAALGQLLAGTGMTWQMIDAKTVALSKAQATGAMELGPVTVEGHGPANAAGTFFDPGPTKGYKAKHAVSATRTSAPIEETPVAVQVVTRDVIDDQKARTLDDALRNVSSVEADFDGFNTAVKEMAIIRGFSTSAVHINGMPTTAINKIDMVNVERIEVLKGPSSVMFGQLEPGGMINVVTKKPLDQTVTQARQDVGSFEYFNTQLDTTGPATADKSLLYRVNVGYKNADSFRDTGKREERYTIAPSFTLRAGDRTTVNLDTTYSREDAPWDDGVSFDANGRPAVSRDTYYNGKGVKGQELRDAFVGLNAEHDVTDALKLRSTFNYHNYQNNIDALRKTGLTAANVVQRRWEKTTVDKNEVQLVTDAVAKFGLGDTKHETLLGTDLRNVRQTNKGLRMNNVNVNLYDPSQALPTFTPGTTLDFSSNTKWAALFAQDQVKLFDDRLHLLVGGRFDRVHTDSRNLNAISKSSDEALTGRTGALYQLTPEIGVYGNVAQSFDPQDASYMDSAGNVLPPEEGLQYEAGVKVDLFNKRLTTTAALFQITKKNVAITRNSGVSYENSGEQRNRGVELDVTGEIGDGWKAIANYSWINSRVMESTTLPVGGPLLNVPMHSGGFWVTHEFQPSTGLQGFGVGGGMTAVGSRSGDTTHSFDLDPYTIFDLMAWYEPELPAGRPVRAQLNVKNLFDTTYYAASSGKHFVEPGDPLTVIGSLNVKF